MSYNKDWLINSRYFSFKNEKRKRQKMGHLKVACHLVVKEKTKMYLILDSVFKYYEAGRIFVILVRNKPILIISRLVNVR